MVLRNCSRVRMAIPAYLKLGRGSQEGRSQAIGVKPPSRSQYSCATFSSIMLLSSGPAQQEGAVTLLY